MKACDVLERIKKGDRPVRIGGWRAEFMDGTIVPEETLDLLREDLLPAMLGEEYWPYHKATIKEVKHFVEIINLMVCQYAPEWSITNGTGSIDLEGFVYADDPETFWVRFEQDIDENNVAAVTIEVRSAERYGSYLENGVGVTAQTTLNGCTFTRRGIDSQTAELHFLSDADGFTPQHTYPDIVTMLTGELARCKRAIEFRSTAETVPGTNMRRGPEWFKEAPKTLKEGRTLTLHPHGFGIGYSISMKKQTPFCSRARKLEERLGISPLFIETIDCD